MDQFSESFPRQGSQVYENVPSRGAQLLVYPPNFIHQIPSETPHKQVKLSNRFKRFLFLAIAIGLLALGLITCSSLSPQWEKIEFIFERIIQRACSKQYQRKWNLAHVILDESGNQVTRFDNQTRWKICNRWNVSPPTIVGLGIYNGTSTNATLVEIFNMLGGAFQVCYEKQGMQNNLIACIIIVFLCIASSIIVGAVSVLARMVPAALVNAFLYLTACVFIIFTNCIEHIKVNHIQSKWGPCYPITNFTADVRYLWLKMIKLYDHQLIRVQYGWPIYLNWAVVGVFLAATCTWFVLKQILYEETSKVMI